MHRAAKVQAHHHSWVQRLYLSLLGVVWGRHKPVGAPYIVVATKIRTYPSRKCCSVGRVCVWTTSWCLYTSTIATIPPLHWHIWCDLWRAPPTPAMKISPKRHYMYRTVTSDCIQCTQAAVWVYGEYTYTFEFTSSCHIRCLYAAIHAHTQKKMWFSVKTVTICNEQ